MDRGVFGAAVAHEHVGDQVGVTGQRAPSRLGVPRCTTQRQEPAVRILVRTQQVQRLIDTVVIAGPQPQLRDEGQHVRQVGRAVVSRDDLVASPRGQGTHQAGDHRARDRRSTCGPHLGMALAQAVQLGEGHPPGRGFVTGQQPGPRIGREQLNPSIDRRRMHPVSVQVTGCPHQ